MRMRKRYDRRLIVATLRGNHITVLQNLQGTHRIAAPTDVLLAIPPEPQFAIRRERADIAIVEPDQQPRIALGDRGHVVDGGKRDEAARRQLDDGALEGHEERTGGGRGAHRLPPGRVGGWVPGE